MDLILPRIKLNKQLTKNVWIYNSKLLKSLELDVICIFGESLLIAYDSYTTR